MLFLYGVKNKVLKIIPLQIKKVQCQNCHTSNIQINFIGRYVHIFGIPLFSIGKTGLAHCTYCKQQLSKIQFTPPLRKEYQAFENDVKIPIWFNIGVIIITFLVVIPWLLALSL
ncbi:hypothetical protein COR50_17305 [Chitinophaga caeni]|uniref:Zinc-ribbon 15 domain-containing protein n=1 Tax=Chitinophaga caeni TaxID=2029983 RepID=A0A291QXM2_9BACT|nr:hypothetical protein COR50_17305 [Chitinophaga caeni]